MKTITFSYSVPTFSFLQDVPVKISQFSKKFATFFQTSYFSNDAASGLSSTPASHTHTPRNLKRFFKKSPLLPVGIVVVVVIFIIIALAKAVGGSNSHSVLSTNSSSGKAEIKKPKATQQINKDFVFSLKDDAGKEVSKIKYTIEDVQLADEIVIKGQRAIAVEGRTFLILNIKITNDFNRSVQINTRDYVRLSVNNSTEKLAADIHNDPVEVQALSTKYTRLGLPINDTDKNLVLQVGELTGTKQQIPLHLQ